MQPGYGAAMTSLDGRVAIITGAGRGIGREHALFFAAEGARVVVNDHGSSNDGSASGESPSDDVVSEIRDAGGEAVSNTDNVADWAGAERLIQTAIDAFGDLDVVVNNAGILRDRTIVNMTEAEWDDVVGVHLKGHFAPTRHAAVYWRTEHKAGRRKRRNLVHTSSTSGLYANPGQANYGAAKSAIATFSQIAAKELSRYDVVSNCIAPGARTRLTLASPGLEDIMAPAASGFDEWSPANISPLAAFLSTADCSLTGETFLAQGGVVKRLDGWSTRETLEQSGKWTVDGLTRAFAATR